MSMEIESSYFENYRAGISFQVSGRIGGLLHTLAYVDRLPDGYELTTFDPASNKRSRHFAKYSGTIQRHLDTHLKGLGVEPVKFDTFTMETGEAK